MPLLLDWKDHIVSCNAEWSPPHHRHILVLLGRVRRYYDLRLCIFKSVSLKVILLLILFSVFINKIILKIHTFFHVHVGGISLGNV